MLIGRRTEYYFFVAREVEETMMTPEKYKEYLQDRIKHYSTEASAAEEDEEDGWAVRYWAEASAFQKALDKFNEVETHIKELEEEASIQSAAAGDMSRELQRARGY